METFILLILYLTYAFLVVAAIAIVVLMFMGLMLLKQLIKGVRAQAQLEKDINEGKLERFI